jgi:hypothetical protein
VLLTEGNKVGILKNGKRDFIEKDYSETIIDDPDFEMSVDDQLPDLPPGDVHINDKVVDFPHHVYDLHGGNTIGGQTNTTGLMTQEKGQVALLIFPVSILLLIKSMMQPSEKKDGSNNGRVHARHWKKKM